MATETEVKTEALPVTTEDKPLEVRILLEIRPGRWGRTFHLFDKDNREISLYQKDAVKMARSILKIAKEQKGA